MKNNDLATEWMLLQNQYDSYEKYSLLIKLTNIVLFSFLVVMNSSAILLVAMVIILWGQDSIWKTFQSRIEDHLVNLEAGLKTEEVNSSLSAFQYNSLFAANRPSTIGLLIEYVKQALRPTVAFPHALLLLLCFVNL